MADTKPRSAVEMDREMKILHALSDPKCRTIVRQLDAPKSVNELVDSCGVPTTTVYRKIDLLTDAGLVERRITIGSDWQHTTRYERTFEELTISVDDRCSIEFHVRE